MDRRKFSKALLTAFTLPVCARAAESTGYPSRSIKLVLPYPAGGNTDLVAREIVQGLSGRIGQSVLVENKPGANSIIGTAAVAKAAPDGYTLLTVIGAFTINPAIYKELPYLIADFAPVSLLGRVNVVLAVGEQIPVKSVSELIAYSKAGNRISYDSSGIGSALHLVGARLCQQTGIRATHIPYKGISQSLPDIVAGRVTFTLNSLSAIGPFIRDGKLKPLAVMGAQRSAELPDIPTIGEAGFPELTSYAWQGLVVPAHTPKAIIERLSAEMHAVLADSDTRRRLVAMGLDPIGSTPTEFDAFIKNDLRDAALTVKSAGITAE